jgi:hypothetical protein
VGVETSRDLVFNSNRLLLNTIATSTAKALITLVIALKPESASNYTGSSQGHLMFFLVSLCLKANAEMVPKTPSCYCMLLM